jgi:AcrR family transcriptional regulator
MPFIARSGGGSRQAHLADERKGAGHHQGAHALLGERGVDGATTAEIAKRAGVTERTLFRYFPSKTDLVRRVLSPPLLNAALSREWEKLEEARSPADRQPAGPETLVHHILHAALRHDRKRTRRLHARC